MIREATQALAAGPTVSAADYWETRARRFAADGEGLAAVCSYGMPEFYTRAIHVAQRLALGPWLRDLRGRTVLDVGCGVGRWSRLMAAEGADVTGIDVSRTMVADAERRARAEELAGRCRFLVEDVTRLNRGCRYDIILGVTVLQHLQSLERIDEAFRRIRAHLADDGRLIILEVAPSRSDFRCDSPVFTAHTACTYLRVAAAHGLRLLAMTGVDPMPLKTKFLPYYRRLPRAVALTGLAATTALSLPVDALLGRRLVRYSWHKLFVLAHASADANET